LTDVESYLEADQNEQNRRLEILEVGFKNLIKTMGPQGQSAFAFLNFLSHTWAELLSQIEIPSLEDICMIKEEMHNIKQQIDALMTDLPYRTRSVHQVEISTQHFNTSKISPTADSNKRVRLSLSKAHTLNTLIRCISAMREHSMIKAMLPKTEPSPEAWRMNSMMSSTS
jgi:hypothetical protein